MIVDHKYHTGQPVNAKLRATGRQAPAPSSLLLNQRKLVFYNETK